MSENSTAADAQENSDESRLDHILGYIRLKMDVALAANSVLSNTRTQVAQMGTFLIVALVVGTGGVQSILGWSKIVIYITALSACVVIGVVVSITRTSTRYTDIVLGEFQAMEAVYSLIVWEGMCDIDALSNEIKAIEKSTRRKIDAENKKHRLLIGSILHSMIHYERHSPFSDDIGDNRHGLPVTGIGLRSERL